MIYDLRFTIWLKRSALALLLSRSGRPALALASICSLFAFSSAFGQGALTPPGPPAATMLTLSQVEPRTPVDSTHTGSGGSAEFLITVPGSYYLTTNVVGVSGEHGINISANNVTLDLNGFSLQGASGDMSGIYIHTGYTNITVCNGTISGWSSGYGIDCLANNVTLERLNISGCGNAGIDATYAAQISTVQVFNTRFTGIVAGNGSVVENCSASGNGDYGFFGGQYCIFKGCSATGNTNTGIYTLSSTNCVVKDCTSSGNGNAVQPADGIDIGDGGSVLDSTVANNTSNGITAGNGCLIERCNATLNGNGIDFNSQFFASNSCVIEHCIASANTEEGDGIYCIGGLISDCVVSGAANGISTPVIIPASSAPPVVVRDCLVESNYNDCISIFGNGSQIIDNTCNNVGGFEGIYVLAVGCRVQGNHVIGGTDGMVIDETNNVVVLNSVEACSAENFSIFPGNDVGPIGAAATNTSPFANISH